MAVTADGRFAVEDRAEPVAGAGEVVVAVERCGICGSDQHLRASGLLPAGAVLGHEFAGTVVGGDPDRAGPADGTRVAVLPARRCGACPSCLAGRGNLCPLQLTTSLGMGLRAGGWAERVAVPASSCHPLPATVGPEAGALVEPYAVALHAVGRSRAAGAPDLAVAVLGAGSVGLLAVAALLRAGVTRLAVAEPRPARAAAAASLGAAVVDGAGRLAGALGGPPDVVFEATGSPAGPGQAVETAAPGGQVVVLGVVGPGQAVPMPGLLWVVKEVDVAPSIAYTDAEFAAAVEAVAAGAVDGIVATCEVRPLADAGAALDDLDTSVGPVKVILSPEK
ncbi:MAG: alcohol dehydrogenase catalytic domain-containing protein [Actinomycetota bacterium]